METYEFSGTFELGSLLIEPVHVRIEELRPVIAAHAHSNTSYEIHYTARGKRQRDHRQPEISGRNRYPLHHRSRCDPFPDL